MDSDREALARRRLLADFATLELYPTRTFVVRYICTLVPLVVVAALAAFRPSLAMLALVALTGGFTQNALGILMHEGSHYFFHANRTVNDLLANALVCLPIMNTVEGYRASHFEHHRRSGESDDPYYELYAVYARPSQLVTGLLRDVLGVTAVASFVQRYCSGATRVRGAWAWWSVAAFVAIHGGLAAGAWRLTGSPFGYVWLWLLPLATIPVAINRFRTIVEHYPGFLGIPSNRTTLVGIVEYACVAPYGYSHHFEHHLAPQIPYYRLSWAHKHLEQQGVRFAPHELASYGYFRTFARLVKEMREPAAPVA